MIWLEILVCLILAVICWLHLYGFIPASFAFFFCILSTWALQVQFLLQIIINRISLLLTDRRKAMRLKIGTAIIITAINISVYCIWIPARLQVSERYIHINEIWDRCEKVIYLLIDAALNGYFILTVQRQLVKYGLLKYGRLVKFNKYIIGFSLSMDLLIISMMSLKNGFVYIQFHPLAYIVKLNIEMSMADLIVKISHSSSSPDYNLSISNNLSATLSSHPPAYAFAPSKISTSPSSSSQQTLFFHSSSANTAPANSNPRLRRRASLTLESLQSYNGSEKGNFDFELANEGLESNSNRNSRSEMEFDFKRASLEMDKSSRDIDEGMLDMALAVNLKREVHIYVEKRGSEEGNRSTRDIEKGMVHAKGGDGLSPSHSHTDMSVEEQERAKRTGVESGMGVYTTVWSLQNE